MNIGTTAPTIGSLTNASVHGSELRTAVHAGARGRRHGGQALEGDADKAAAAFADHKQQAQPAPDQLPMAEQIFDFALRRALDLASVPMNGVYGNAKNLFEAIRQSVSGQQHTESGANVAADPVALFSGRPRRSAGIDTARPDAPRETPAQRAIRRHPLADWMPGAERHKGMFNPGQRAIKLAAIKA